MIWGYCLLRLSRQSYAKKTNSISFRAASGISTFDDVFLRREKFILWLLAQKEVYIDQLADSIVGIPFHQVDTATARDKIALRLLSARMYRCPIASISAPRSNGLPLGLGEMDVGGASAISLDFLVSFSTFFLNLRTVLSCNVGNLFMKCLAAEAVEFLIACCPIRNLSSSLHFKYGFRFVDVTTDGVAAAQASMSSDPSPVSCSYV